ncbi:MAG: glycine cleavage system protein T [Gammaproteobacteria bacterium]|nr:glycine cleavage system protein T [Gammaproteobacteria bacterium]|tara:strand:- start:8539 stop:9693 length:1155 start_codon:yes stop_codon:yes gene_type:complete
MSESQLPLLIGIGSRIRKSPYYESDLKYGVTGFTVYNKMYLPTGFSGPEKEYHSLVNDVTFGDFAAERQIEINGPDAYDFIRYIQPRNLEKCDIGSCKYILLTDNDGGIINDACLLRLEDNKFWISPGDGDVILWLQGVAINSGMNVTIHEPDVSPLQISGPKSGKLVQKLFKGKHDDLGYYKSRQTTLEDIPMVIARTGWSGELSYELYLQDKELGNKLFELVYEAAEEFNGRVIAPNAIRTIEGGLLSYGGDFSREHNPYTIGLGRLVDLDQEIDFIGKEALRKIKEKGLTEKLVGVELEGDPIIKAPENFWPVNNSDNKKIGRVSRAFFSPRLQKNIGLAIVDIDYADEETKFSVATPNGDLKSVVVSLPWFKAETDTNLE